MMPPLRFLLPPLIFITAAAQAQSQQAAPDQMQQPKQVDSFFQTFPYVDEKMPSIQQVPGKVWLAWYDQGGPGKAFDAAQTLNKGSCELNPCLGENATYLNTFRTDEGVSVSYTKPLFYWQDKAWKDRWAGTNDTVPLDEFYIGWFPEGSWVRISLAVPKAGNYTGDIYLTCPNSGDLQLSLSKFATGETMWEEVLEDLPSTTYFHDWEILPKAFTMEVPESESWWTLTISFKKVGGDKKIHWGNLIWFDFKPVE